VALHIPRAKVRSYNVVMKLHILGLSLFIITLSIGLFLTWSGIESQSNQLAQPVSDAIIAEPMLSHVDKSPDHKELTPSSKDIDSELEETRIEYFSDDRRIGRRGKDRIELRCFNNSTGRFAELKFYTRSEYGSWFEVQSFKFEKDGVTDCDPIIEDFNNDGLKDFTYQSMVAARGSNEVRKLFIFDKEQDALVYIKDSENYPNLSYNKKLNCVDSFIVTGSTETVFLRIEGDTLKEFASVSTGSERVVTVTRKDGTRVILRREEMDPDNFDEVYRRFSSYNPLR